MIRKTGVLLYILLLIANAAFAQSDTILTRYKQYLLHGADAESDPARSLETITAGGRWNDIDYQDQEPANWQPLIHLKRVRDMALVWADPHSSFYHDNRMWGGINAGLNHWLEHRYKSSNWWHNEIGVPQQMRDIIVLVRDHLSPAGQNGAMEVLAQFHIYDNATGANLTWSADLGFHYGVLVNDRAMMQHYRDLLLKEIKITTEEGLQPDYSFHQHGRRLQMFQYGKAFLWENARIAWEVRGTSMAFPGEKIDLLINFVLNGWQWMSRGIHTVPGTMDRSASRIDALHAADIRRLIPFLKDLDPSKETAMVRLDSIQNGQSSLQGYRYYPYSDFDAWQQDEFSFFLKTISTRTLATESINHENLKGHLLNSGDAYLIRDGQEYFNLMPVWNWDYLPGITTFRGAQKVERKPFVGSVSDGQSGLASMDYMLISKDGRQRLAAKKSWFSAAGKVVCLVAGLRGEGVDTAYTVLDQCRWRGAVTVNKLNGTIGEGEHSFKDLKWIFHSGFAYVPLAREKACIGLHQVSGTWQSINASAIAPPVTENVFLARLQHTGLSRPSSLAYVLAPCNRPSQARKLSEDPGCRVVRNDSACQAVTFKNGPFMSAFFEPGNVRTKNIDLGVDGPCLVMIEQGRIYVSDPTHAGVSINLSFNGRQYRVKLSNDGFTQVIDATGSSK